MGYVDPSYPLGFLTFIGESYLSESTLEILSHTYFITVGWQLTCFERWNRYWVSHHLLFPLIFLVKYDPYCERFFSVFSLAWFGVELTIRDAINYGEGCKCFTFQKRSLSLFSIIPRIWQTQFHSDKFALLIGIFWRKLLLKTRNAFTFFHLFKILVLRTVWLWCARNCHILWGAGPLLSGCPSTHRGRGGTAISESFTLACLNDLKAGFYFWRVTF